MARCYRCSECQRELKPSDECKIVLVGRVVEGVDGHIYMTEHKNLICEACQ